MRLCKFFHLVGQLQRVTVIYSNIGKVYYPVVPDTKAQAYPSCPVKWISYTCLVNIVNCFGKQRKVYKFVILCLQNIPVISKTPVKPASEILIAKQPLIIL